MEFLIANTLVYATKLSKEKNPKSIICSKEGKFLNFLRIMYANLTIIQ